MSSGQIKVIKIGGSIFRKENVIDIAEFVVKNFEPYKTIIVVSALGRPPYPYSTDELLRLFEEFKNNNSNCTIESKLSNQLMDISKSFVVSCGENIAAGLLAFAINYVNPLYRAIPLNAFQSGIITTSKAEDADIIDVNVTNIINLMEEKFTPVICGFQGVSKEGYITTLKRGGTDITAAFIAKIVKSQEIHIIKDVEGLKSAPPSIVPNSITIEKCHLDELAESSYNGNPIINPEAINIIQETDTKVIIRSIFSDKYTTSSKNTTPDNLVSNLSVKENVTKFAIFLPPQMKNKTQILDTSLNKIYQNRISLDFINLDIPNNIVSFIVDNNQEEKIRNILKDLSLDFKTIHKLSKVSVIGYNMRGKPGVMYRINKALLSEKVLIIQAQDSHISISLLVPEKFMKTTIKSLHREFFE
ncbi:MAG: aspartate kinase [Candidatus Calescibacterium sp.]|nr:aspartate kinase [Candidatus Calescibacterium sp.]MCX7972823.1 aspartate kinase [bacterium]MDW8195188.1 aspartate kinase [Candidatus Calescibacterium sp.]